MFGSWKFGTDNSWLKCAWLVGLPRLEYKRMFSETEKLKFTYIAACAVVLGVVAWVPRALRVDVSHFSLDNISDRRKAHAQAIKAYYMTSAPAGSESSADRQSQAEIASLHLASSNPHKRWSSVVGRCETLGMFHQRAVIEGQVR